jgi:hypothetical protein
MFNPIKAYRMLLNRQFTLKNKLLTFDLYRHLNWCFLKYLLTWQAVKILLFIVTPF